MHTDLTPYHWHASILRNEFPPVSVFENIISENAIWQTGLDNGVLSLSYHLLSAADSLNSLPTSLRDRLKNHTLNAVATEMLRQHDLGDTLELFNQAGIRFLLMKGTPLAYALYPQPHLRERCDTDILFSNKEDAEAAWLILNELGYQRRNTTSGEFVGYQFSCSRKLSHGFHQVLDIHNRLNDYQFFADTFDFNELYQQSIAVHEVSPSSRRFHPVHALLHACMHRIAHIPHGEENRLIWLYDLHLLVNTLSKQDWQMLAELATQKGIAGVCLDGLKISRKLFQTELDGEAAEQLATSAKQEKISPHEKEKRWELYYLAFKSTPGIVNKLKQLRNHFFPSVEYMMKKYQPRSKLQLPYLYVYRVVKGVKRYF